MIGYLKLELTEVDSFCGNINHFKSEVNAIEHDKKVYIKSLISLLTLDLSKELCVEINSDDEYELKLFKEIIERYGGRVDERN